MELEVRFLLSGLCFDDFLLSGTRDLGKRKRDFVNDEGVVDRKHRRRDEDSISTRTNRSTAVLNFPVFTRNTI